MMRMGNEAKMDGWFSSDRTIIGLHLKSDLKILDYVLKS